MLQISLLGTVYLSTSRIQHDIVYYINICKKLHVLLYKIPYSTLHHRPTILVWACHDSSARMCLHWLARTKAKKRNMSTASDSALYQKSGWWILVLLLHAVIVELNIFGCSSDAKSSRFARFRGAMCIKNPPRFPSPSFCQSSETASRFSGGPTSFFHTNVAPPSRTEAPPHPVFKLELHTGTKMEQQLWLAPWVFEPKKKRLKGFHRDAKLSDTN